MCDKDITVDYEKQQTCGVNTHHIGAIPKESAFQR